MTSSGKSPNDPLRDKSPTSEEWNQIDAIFHEVVELDGAEREKRLLELTGDNSQLRMEVSSLIDHDNASVQLPALRPPVELAIQPIRQPGSELERYRLLFPVAVNRASEVWCAEDTESSGDPQRVAIKFLRDEVNSERRLERFRNEAELLSRFRHPNVAEFIECGQDENGVPYIVMRYISGTPITEFADKKTLSIDDRLQLMIRVCDAVSYAHRFLVVHRDLKPSNILVTAKQQPVILDFGISKTISDEESESTALSSLTETNERPMTPAYASPEQVHGEPITTATDVYALGLILYELVSGHHAYADASHPTETRLLDRICNSMPRKPSDVVSEVAHGLPGSEEVVLQAPRLIAALRNVSEAQLQRRLRGGLDGVAMRALAKDSANRYGSIGEFRTDLENVMNYRPVAAKLNDDRLRNTIRQHPIKSVLLAATAFGLLAASVVGWMSLQSQKRVSQQLAEAEARVLQADAVDSAREAAQTGQYQKAERLLAELELESPDVRFDAASAYREIGKPSHGLKTLEGAVENPSTKSLRLRLLLDAGRMKEAEKLVENATEEIESTADGALALIEYRHEIAWNEGAVRLLDKLQSQDFDLSTDQQIESRLLRAQVSDRPQDLGELLANSTSTRPGPLSVRGKVLLLQAKHLAEQNQVEEAIEKYRDAIDNFETTSPDHIVAFRAMLAMCELTTERKLDVGFDERRQHLWTRMNAAEELDTEAAAWCAVDVMRHGDDEARRQVLENFGRQPIVDVNPYIERQFLLFDFELANDEERWKPADIAIKRLCELEQSLWGESSIEHAYVLAAHAHVCEQLGDPAVNSLSRRVKEIVSGLQESLPRSRALHFLRPVTDGTQAAMPAHKWIDLYQMHRSNSDEEQRSMILHIQRTIQADYPRDAELLQPALD